MQNTYWFLLIQFILQSHLSTHGVRAGFLRWTNKIPPAATKWSELNEIDCTDFLKHINPSTKLTESQSDELVAFWKQGEHLKNLMEISTTNFPDLIQETNKILLSPKETWHSAIIKLFDQNYLSHPYQYYCKKSAFFEIMRQFLSLENIPLNFLQVTHIELLKLKDRLEEAFGLYNLNGLDFLNKLLDISKERYVTSINKLEDRDLNKFVASQMELGEHGRVLIGDWLSGDQKALLKFWMLQTQFVQTRAIGLYKDIKLLNIKLPENYLDWVSSFLSGHSATVLNYIESLLEEYDIQEFISTQKEMSPYRLEIREDLAPSDQMKVIKFWSSYVDFFLLMYKIEHTKSLQRAIEDLVVDSFEETCIMMRKFLDQIKGTGSIRDEPVFLQFLEFYYNNTPADEQRVSINAAISHFKESVQQKTLAYSNSEMIKQVVYWYADMIRQAVYSFSNMIKQAIIGKLKFL